MSSLLSMAGRINRKKYIINFLKILGCVLLLLLLGLVLLAFKINAIFVTYGILIILAYLVFANITKRLHDISKSGYFAIIVILGMQFSVSLGLITISMKPIKSLLDYIGSPVFLSEIISGVFTVLGLIICLYILFKKGDTGENKYGKDPLDISADVSEEQKNAIINSYIKEHP